MRALYDRAGYSLRVDYRRPAEPPLREEDAAWAASLLAEQFRDHVPLSPTPVDRAPLRVLESANMPAVLIESGFLTNPGQEQLLSGADFHGAVAQAIVEAILRFRTAGAIAERTAR